MKYLKFSLLATLSAIALSCNKEVESTQLEGKAGITKISAYFGDANKTVLGSDEKSVLWSPNDEISVFYDGDGMKFQSINSTPKAKTIFLSSGLFLYGGTEDAGDEKDFLWGIYPYSSDNAQDGEILTLTVPSLQTAVEGSFGRGAYPSIARSKTTDLAFYNVCGGIRFSVTATGVRRVVFCGLNNDTVAGKVQVAFNHDGKPAVTSVVEGVNEITLDTPDGESLVPGKFYYISVLPTVFSNGFKMMFYTDTKHAKLEVPSVAEIKRSVFGSLENADSGLIYEEGSPITPATRVFTASFSGTKTSLDESGQLVWDADESVFLSDMDSVDTPAIEKQSDQFGFLRTTKMKKSVVLGGTPSEYFSLDNNVYCTVPAVQGGFPGSACITMAKTGIENTLEFTPVNAVLKISLSEEVDSVRFIASEGVNIAGECPVDMSGTPSLSEPVKGFSSIIVKSPVNEKRSVFYFGLLPCITNNISLEIYKDGMVTYKYLKQEVTFSKGKIKTMNVGTLTYTAIDLGLSVKWALCNIDAATPEEYGRYFAWGDVVGQTWNGSSWSGGGFSTYPTYEVDSNNNLKPEYDAAHVLLGGSWRMPTKAEQQELIDNCTCTWTSNYKSTGVAGRIFTSKKEGYTDKSIFLPAAGYGGSSYLKNAGSSGNYLSGTFYGSYYAWGLVFGSGDVYTNNVYRHDGFAVRPVSD